MLSPMIESACVSTVYRIFALPSIVNFADSVILRSLANCFCSICTPSQLIYDKYTNHTRCGWKDETVRERTGRLPSHVKTKKMKSLILYAHHAHGCLSAS